MKTIIQMYEERVQVILPGCKILRKRDSRWYRFLGWLLKPILPDFMNRFSNAGLDGNIYLGENEWQRSMTEMIPILAHETFHLYERSKSGNVKFVLAYLFPQYLAALAVLAPFSLWFLTALVFLAPLPAPFRANIEQDGYQIQLFALIKLRPGVDVSEYIRQIVDFFFNQSYYFMWPFNRVQQEMTLVINARRPDLTHPVYRFVNEFIDEVRS